MHATSRSLLGISCAALVSACGTSQLQTTGAVSIGGGGGGAEAHASVEEHPSSAEHPSSPGQLRLKSSVCNGESVKPEYASLGEEALIAFLAAHNYETKVSRARGDLIYVDITNVGEKPVRLRVAVLKDAPAAGRELHEAVLQHGPGSWGVHRSNLAVLAPIGEPGEIIEFAVKTKLACWGVLTMAGLDDSFVIPGGYREL